VYLVTFNSVPPNWAKGEPMVSIENNSVKVNGKTIGKLEGKTLLMNRNHDRHFYRVLESWCINIDVVNCGAERFVIDTDNKERYTVSLSAIKALRSKLNMFVTFGQERQLAIPIQCWDKYSHSNLTFPTYIGTPAAEFADKCTGRWQSRLIAYGQTEIRI
jgi:hypothetical protein